jgi:hypothetical protein
MPDGDTCKQADRMTRFVPRRAPRVTPMLPVCSAPASWRRAKWRTRSQFSRTTSGDFKAGDIAKAQVLLDELEGEADTQYVSPLLLAAIHFAAGNEARGYELLNAAVDARARGVIFLNVSTSFADQRGDPQFTAILKRIGLPTDGP